MRGAWLASQGKPVATVAQEIRERAGCSHATAWRVEVLRRGASMRCAQLWLDGGLTLRQLERIVMMMPFDEDAQLTDAAITNPVARAMLKRTA